jgi:leucyl aminopeptidase
MLPCFTTRQVKTAVTIQIVLQAHFTTWLNKQSTLVKQWLASIQFKGEAGNISVIPDTAGKIQSVVCCVADIKNLWGVGGLSSTLPEGIYILDVSSVDYPHYAIAWGLGAYQFDRYKKPKRKSAQLILPSEVSSDYVNNMVESIYLVRDLINTPTNDMGPTELASAAAALCKIFKVKMHQVMGDDLLEKNYPLIHAVGRASEDPPRLLDFHWGNKKHPKLTLVGKGVCFDTGGLDLKPSSAMLLMKKDMGGAAHALGLARMVMAAKLPVYLRVLIPAVENSVSANAYRPGDVIPSRKGLTVEITNTDAEGRLVLADALTEAVADNPDLLIDFATLTGAARVALGTELPALFTNQDDVAQDVLQHAQQQFDPLWRMPLFSLYRDSLNSSIADLNNCPLESYGGAITAALFLKEFVPDTIPWMHFDLMAWNLKARPGRPQGGEAMGLRALFSYLVSRFG